MKIIFLCKYNRFRSRVAEASFRKYNKNKKIKISSRGFIKGFNPVSKSVKDIGKSLGLTIKGNPKGITEKEMDDADLIVIVANNIPSSFIKRWKKKIIIWKIPDCGEKDKNNIDKTSRQILKKTLNLIKELGRKGK
jgi:protein-tyrosine-phosphatase